MEFYSFISPLKATAISTKAAIKAANSFYYGDEVIDALSQKESTELAFLDMYLDFRAQTLNGGITQYIENHYHTYDTGFSSIINTNTDALDKLIELTKKVLETHGFKPLEILLQILKKITIEVDEEDYIYTSCDTCFGSGQREDEDGEEHDCEDCMGDGEEEEPNHEHEHLTTECRERFAILSNEFFEAQEAIDSAVMALFQHTDTTVSNTLKNGQ